VGGLQELADVRVSMTKIDADAGLNTWQNSFVESLRDNYAVVGLSESLAMKSLIEGILFIAEKLELKGIETKKEESC